MLLMLPLVLSQKGFKSMNTSDIRKGVERLIVDTINPVKVDFKEEGLNEDTFLRISNPIVITEPLTLGGKEFRNTCRIVLRIFSKNKAESLDIYDSIANEFGLYGYKELHNGLFIHPTSIYTEFSGKDSTGSYFQLNCGIEFFVDTFKV